MNSLFSQSLNVINEGLASFADNIRQAGGKVTPLNWQPPAEGDRFTGLSLAGLINHPVVERANQVAMGRYLDAQPVLVDVLTAAVAIPAMAEQN